MQQYRALCNWEDRPGSTGYGWVYVTASGWYEATQFLRAQYGTRLITDAQPIPAHELNGRSLVGAG